MENKILSVLARRNYTPVKPKTLARAIGVTSTDYAAFRKALRGLVKTGRVQFGKNHTIRATSTQSNTVIGIFRRTASGRGFVRPPAPVAEIVIVDGCALDAATGDEVQARIVQPARGESPARGEVQHVLERATRQFVGAYHERDGLGLVRIDGGVFSHSVVVGDPGAKGAKPDDKVVIEMLRFPTLDDRGEGVITEVLGARGAPGVDTLSIIRSFDLPDEFPPDVLAEARDAAESFREDDFEGREDHTGDTIITIDPASARDFDDAISLTRDPATGHWQLGVHIADVGHFAAQGSAMDREARRRATSVYLPQRVIPMFPELISNGLASLQQGKIRYVKSAFLEFNAEGQRVHARFANSVIRVTKRFSYEQAFAILVKKSPRTPVNDLLHRMRELALILRKRRFKRGALELSMPEIELEYDEAGKVVGAHFLSHDVSHQIIEEFMLAANEAVAEQLAELGVSFLRRIHPKPDEAKLKAFAEFAGILGYELKQATDRFSLQRVLDQSAYSPERQAVHYALLRSLKQAVYSPFEEGHYALASRHYCHFTSPIRRYPDLTVHRLLDQWLRDHRVGSDATELTAIGDHCSRMERRAENAERELIKLRLLEFLSSRIGAEFDAVITGVAEYGFFAQAEQLPIEGRIHISTLNDDYFIYNESAHTLEGRRTKKRYRLGDKVRVEVVRVDLIRRQLDFRVASDATRPVKRAPRRKRA